jgi:threonylcarbamoyladenosine tRNA methylthiotransferase MtaB
VRKIAFKTLGCRLNQFETDALVTRFHNAGYQIAGKGEKADAVIINTCTVTNQSDHKSNYAVNYAAAKNPGAVIVVAGCMANNHKESLQNKSHITYVVDNARKSSIFSLVDGHFKGEISHPESLPSGIFDFETVDKSLHTRTFIKVQDGCDNFCTFCIIPTVRGKAISRKPADIVENVRRVIDNGFKEIVITGVNIGRYDYEGTRLEDILRMILEVEGDFRVRISSIEPDGFSNRFHELFQHPKMTPHLHLCLQSGSESILLKMRRMYTAKSFMEILDSFRKHFPQFNFSTDIIVGFPGETDADFEATKAMAEQAKFTHIHTFRYSRRSGTRADRMDDQVPENIKAERSEVIRNISDLNQGRYFRSLLGSRQRVLVEKVAKLGNAFGYGENYVPISFVSKTAVPNSFYDVELLDLAAEGKNWILGRGVL